MKTLKEIGVFFGTFFMMFAMLSIAISALTWEPIYDTIHSPWSVLTFLIALFCAIMVTIDYTEQREA
jgi:hypothetical protein